MQWVNAVNKQLPASEIAITINTLRPRQNGRLFADDTFKCIFLNENIWISIKISLKFIPKGLINNIQALVLIMAWRRPGDKPLSELMLVRSLTHICVTRPQWVNSLWPRYAIWQDTSGLTLVQVMACCMVAPSHYLNQSWLTISGVQWQSTDGNAKEITQPSNIKINLKIPDLKCHSNLPGAYELKLLPLNVNPHIIKTKGCLTKYLKDND